MYRFPSGFYWGASTSSHQVEGGTDNNWTRWERAHAERLAQTAEAEYANLSPVWEDIKEAALSPANYISGRGCDHYNRYEEDFDIIAGLGHNAHRLSIEWSRIEPRKGEFNLRELQHYRDVIRSLRRRGIEPFITIWHWTLPVWVADEGGWESRRTIKYFERYARVVAALLAPDVKYWVTLNEPWVYSLFSYFTGQWPPQKTSLRSLIVVIHNLIAAHNRTYTAIKKADPDAQIGIAKNNTYFEAYLDRPVNRFFKRQADNFMNFYILNRIRQDFIGLNQYFKSRINIGRHQPRDAVVSDMGWDLYPEAIYYALKELRFYRKPIFILENGLADHRDIHRGWYIREVLKNIARAMDDGINVRGYFHWSLLDNFEWDAGFWPRFGLVEVNYATLERRVRDSAREYAAIIKSGGIEYDKPSG